MKNLFKLFASVSVAATVLASCSLEITPTIQPKTFSITVKASVDELVNDGPDTKTYIGSYQEHDKAILWGTGEYMKLALTAGENTTFANSADSSADSSEGEPEATFAFTVSPGEAASYTYQGLYPASAAATSSNTNAANYKVNLPAIQNATASSYDPAAYIMVAKPEPFTSVQTDWKASFRRATALNKITLKNFDSAVTINKVKITAESKKLAGGRHFDLTTGESLEVYGTDATIDVLYTTPLNGTSMDIWFTSWGVEIAAGETLTITAYTTDSKSYTKTITVPAEKTIKFQEGYLNTLGANMSGITPVTVATISGDFVILAKHNTTYYALKGEANGTRIASVNYTGSTTSYNGDASIIWTITPSSSSYTIKHGSNYLGWNGGSGSSANNAALIAEDDYDADKCLMLIDAQGNDVYNISVKNTPARILAKNTGENYFAFYASTGQYSDIVLVPATALETVATPTFSPAAGEVTSGTEVTISCTTNGATIHYTVDGTVPTSSSATYSSPIEITATTTIKAIAVKDGMADSEVATAQYTIAGVTDYSVIETSNVTLSTAGGTSASTATVNGNSALKAGTGSVAGAVKITVPAGTTTLHLHAAGWNGETVELGITGATASPSSLSLTADSGIKNNTPFTLSGNVEDYYFCISLSGISTDTQLTFTATTGKRFVIWGVNAEAGASVTWNLESIAITTPPTKTTYTEGETFDPTGMVVTGHFVDADDNTNVKDEAVTGYTISPNGALSTSDDHVTITYQGQTANQSITVNAAATPTYDFETIAELNALATSEATNKSGHLTNAVVSYVPNSGNAIIKDATGSILLYKSNHGLHQGQTFTGNVAVTIKLYNNCAELTACDASFTGSTATVAPVTMTLAQLAGNLSTYQNAYVKVDNLTVTAVSGKNITVTDDGGTTSYIVYSSAADATCGVGDVLSVVGTIAQFSGNDQIKAWATSDITITSSAPKAITFSQPASGGSFTVSVGGSPISSGTTVASNTLVTLIATPASGYTFNGWTVSGATVADASSASTTFTMGTSAVSIAASFKEEGSTAPAAGTVLWTDTFGDWGGSSTTFTQLPVLSNYTYTGRSGYSDNTDVTLTASSNQVRGATSSATNMTSGHLWFNKSQNATVTTSSIRLYGATSLVLTYDQATSGSSLTAGYSTDGGTTWTDFSASGPAAGNEYTFSVQSGTTSVILRFVHSSSNAKNTRFDNPKLAVGN